MNAQSTALLLGNPQISSLALSLGYGIQASVSQARGGTTSNTTITYQITAPSGGYYNGTVGTVNWELLSPGSTSVSFTVTWTGSLNVTGSYVGGNFTAGYINAGSTGGPTSPTTFSRTLSAGTGSFVFGIQPGQTGTATITLAANIGSPSGEHKPYLNDFLGKGYTNYTVWRPFQGNWYTSNNEQGTQWGLPGDVPVPGDFDGDGISDYAVWRPTEGNWYVTLSSTGQQIVTQWGLPGDFPIAAADYDGDGKTDYAVWRPSTGTWYVKLSSTGATVITQFGLPGDTPLVGNFDGDAKTDYVVWRPSESNWYVLSSSTGTESVMQWGLPGDIPVPGDYDRDGKTDYAIWRPSEGNYYVSLSGSGGQLSITPLGTPGDIPVPGDYNGDGKTDYAVWRPSEANWYVYLNGSQNGEDEPFQWGLNGDTAIGQALTSAPYVITSSSEPGVDSILFPLPAVQPFRE